MTISMQTSRIISNPFTEDIDEQLFMPALENAVSYDCMMGYFDSTSFKILAKSLIHYLNWELTHKMRLIISPHLSKEDLLTLQSLYENHASLDYLFDGFKITENTLKNHTLTALAYLIKHHLLELRIAVPKTGLFHVKCWILKQKDDNTIVLHGSGNHTGSGLSRNFEYLVSENSGHSIAEAMICERIAHDFENIWHNQFDGIICGQLTPATIEFLLNEYHEKISTQSKHKIMQTLANTLKNEEMHTPSMEYFSELADTISNYKIAQLKLPTWLDYRNGDYKHQGEAIDAWFSNNHIGILSIATGGGKTLTALTAATLLSETLSSLFLVIAVPTKALMEQWTKEVALFNVTAINLNHYTTKQHKIIAIKDAGKRLRFHTSKVEVIIISHDALKSDLMQALESLSQHIQIMLIADEVHNLGSIRFIEQSPTFFTYKLGLSATPVRQYDTDGTDFLFQYFGPVVYDFPLEKAIGNCLVPYNYYTHPLYLTIDETEAFSEITEKIKKLSYAATMDQSSDEFKLWSNYCIQRRRIIETAENKILKLKSCLYKEHEHLSYTLIFCSDKNPEQLKQVNQLLNQYHINYHQITGEETTDINLLNQLIENYNSGILQVLTSKRVLDEGFNVPQTKTAYILANNTTEKQWAQRLGRVLRKAPGKEYAEVHDFIVLPTMNDDVLDEDFLNLLKSEAKRLQFFIQHANNGTERYGSLSTLTNILNMIEH